MKHFVTISIIILGFGVFFYNYAFANEELHYGFKKTSNEQPLELDTKTKELLEEYDAAYIGNTKEKVLYLTFDNGYENGFTTSILDTLKKENIKATFFLTGHYVKSAGDLVKRMVDEGHIIGNHSDTHPNMARLSEEQILKEWQSFDKLLKDLTGIKRTHYARPPEGTYNEKLLAAGKKYGYRHIFWSVAFKDWEKDVRRGSGYPFQELKNQMHPGAIILMHTVAQDNAEALPLFIEYAKEKGYKFGNLDDL